MQKRLGYLTQEAKNADSCSGKMPGQGRRCEGSKQRGQIISRPERKVCEPDKH